VAHSIRKSALTLQPDQKLRIACAALLAVSLLFTLYEELYLRRWLYHHFGRHSVVAGSLPNFLAVIILSFAVVVIRLPKVSRDITRTVLSIVTGLTLYEIAQIWMPHQVFDWNDIAATLIGGVIAWVIIRILLLFQRAN
jgi:hypothetical protein